MDRGYSGVGRSLYLSATYCPDKPALVEIDGPALTYRELNEDVNRLGNYLLGRGLRKGDHVAILSDNSLEHVVALYAAAKIGGVTVVVDPKWTPTEIARTLEFFDCRMLIVDSRLLDKLAKTDLGKLALGTIAYEKDRNGDGLMPVVEGAPASEPDVAVQDHDLFTLMLTSGTTGMPKGCMRTHHNVEMGCISGMIGKTLDQNSKELVVVPIYYGNGRSSIMNQIYLGGTVYVMAPFDAERAAAVIEREQITAIGLAPTMCGRLLKVPKLERFDFSSLQVLRKAGSPFSQDMVREMTRRVTPNIYQGYASTETGGVTLLKPNEDMGRPGSSGRRRWGVEMAIVDDDGKSLPRGEEGEIRVRSPNVCQGYYKNPEEQERVFCGDWYRTGDLGRIDGEGHLYVVGRRKEMIKTGSINVSPREVENAILDIRGVEDVAVIGVPEPEWGELVKAFIVLKDDAHLSESDIVAHCRETLAAYKIPKRIEFTTNIERNTLGKLTSEFKARVLAGGR